MPPYAFLTAITARTLLTFPFPHTYFQPDEFYQALEPAHHFVFRYGYLSWEWLDLPILSDGTFHGLRVLVADTLWEAVVGGRMRSWLWPGVFAGCYQVLKTLGLDHSSLLVLVPRVVGVLVAALTDLYTYRLSSKIIGHGSASTALFLSLTSLFNAHLLTRSLSTSPETLLTVMALYYFPLRRASVPELHHLRENALLRSVVAEGDRGLSEEAEKEMMGMEDSDATFWGVNDLDYVLLDRAAPEVTKPPLHVDRLALAICLATLALCIRPTMLTFWAFLGLNLLWRTAKKDAGWIASIQVLAVAISSVLLTVAASTGFDYLMTGRLYFPLLTFIYQNVIANVSSFYGSTNYTYHFVQSLPIMLFPIWIWWAKGFFASLLPSQFIPHALSKVDRPPGLRTLARAITFSVLTLSLSPHSEWRFLHPLLPPLLLFAIPSFSLSYTPTILGAYYPVRALRQYVRMDKIPFYVVLLSGVIPFLYLNVFHGKAQVEVMNVLRRGELGAVDGIVVLAPCHSTPWMSHLHTDTNGWFLTCEPPVGVHPDSHRTQQEWFYSNPVQYLNSVFPYPPSQLRDIPHMTLTPNVAFPSHIIIFGELLLRRGTITALAEPAPGELVKHDEHPVLIHREARVGEELERLGYEQVWSGWNGIDVLQDEQERKGGVRVWRKVRS